MLQAQKSKSCLTTTAAATAAVTAAATVVQKKPCHGGVRRAERREG